MLSSEDPVGRASGSSPLSEKGNVDPGNALEVETVDLDRFVVELAGRSRLKLDIRMEPLVLRQLTETGTLGDPHVLVEMHDRAAGGGRTPEGTAVRSLLEPHGHVRLDWD